VANTQKHPTDPIEEWLQEEENSAPTRSRSARALSAYVKIAKTPAGKSRKRPPGLAPVKPDLALAREPGGDAKSLGRQSQPASFDHLLKMHRLSKLRAPYDYKPAAQPSPPASPKPAPRAKARAFRVKK